MEKYRHSGRSCATPLRCDRDNLSDTVCIQRRKSTWDTFKKAISAKKCGSDDEKSGDQKSWYRVRKTWKNASSQIGAFQTFKKAKQCADQHAGYHVYNDAGKKVYTQPNSHTRYRPKATTFRSERDRLKLTVLPERF